MAKDTKTYIFYPLQILGKVFKWDLDKFLPATSINNIKLNIYEVTHNGEKILYSLITEKPYWEADDGNLIPEEIKADGIIFGRLLKLRNDAISRIDLDVLKEEILTNAGSKFLLESSYFAIDTKNNIMLGQYNKNSVNVLSSRAGEIFKNSLSKLNLGQNFEYILPIPTDELIKVIIKKESSVHNYKLFFKDINLNYLEKVLDISSEKLKILSEQNNFNFIMTISFRSKPRFTDKVFHKMKGSFTKDKKLDKLKISTEDGNFDLLNQNYLYYPISIEIPVIKDYKDYEKLRDNIQKEMYKLLSEYNDNISKELNSYDISKKSTNLDDFL